MFGKLTVLHRADINSKSGNARWVCQCKCGNTSIVIGSKLRIGYTKSCGCNKTSETACGESGTRLHRIWTLMFKRCYDPESHNYHWYGGRGITICPEWKDFFAFKEWAITHGYKETLTIDRIDSLKGYSPINCRWATAKEQQNNKRSNKILKFNSQTYTATQFADALSLSTYTVFNRLKMGWTPERIAKTPERARAKYDSIKR